MRLGFGGVGRHDGDGQRPGDGGGAGRGIDQVVKAAPGAEPPPVAAGRCSAAGVERERAQRLAGTARVGDRDAPGAAVGRAPGERDVAAEIDERAGEPRPRPVHGEECATCGEPLADTAQIDRGPLLDACAAAVDVQLDLGACTPAGGRPGGALVQLVEGPVVAGRDESRQDRRVVAPTGVLTCAQRRRERRRAVRRPPPTVLRGVQPRRSQEGHVE